MQHKFTFPLCAAEEGSSSLKCSIPQRLLRRPKLSCEKAFGLSTSGGNTSGCYLTTCWPYAIVTWLCANHVVHMTLWTHLIWLCAEDAPAPSRSTTSPGSLHLPSSPQPFRQASSLLQLSNVKAEELTNHSCAKVQARFHKLPHYPGLGTDPGEVPHCESLTKPG